MLRDWIAARRGAALTGLVAVVGVGVVAAVAVVFPGYPAQRVHLDDGTVWVANQTEQAIGRANPDVLELNTVIETGVVGGEVVQSGGTVLLVDSANATLDIVDPVDAELSERVALPPEGAEVLLAADTAILHSPASGEVWIVPLAELADFDPANPAVLTLGEGSVVSLDDAGAFFALAPALGDLYRLDARSGETLESWEFPVGAAAAAASDNFQLTSVGGRWVVLDRVGARLVLDGAEVALDAPLTISATTQLQAPAVAGEEVLVAAGDGLLAVPLGGGDPVELVPDAAGRPAAPLAADGCVFAAWSSGSAWRSCGGEQVTLALAEMPGTALLAFERNADRVVLNDARGGASWAVADAGQLIDNWAALITPDEDRDDIVDDPDVPPEIDPQQQPPVAVDDEFGARPGRTTVLPVLLNDYDPNADVLVISDVEPVDESLGRIDLVSRNQQLQLTLAPEATGSFAVRYTITDGRGGSASATVSVSVRGDDENAPPRQVRSSSAVVAESGRVSTNVLGDWIDPDGDPFYLVAATTPEPGVVSAKPEGVVVFGDAGDGADRAVVGLTMSDGRDEASGTLEVDVRPADEVPIVVDPWVVLATAGDEVTVRPLGHVRGGAGSIRLTAVPERPGATIEPSFESGTFQFSSERVGTQYVGFTVTDGRETATGVVRIDVVAPPDAGTRPITVPQTVFVRTLDSALVDPTATDIDPAGGVLVVTGVTDVPEGSGIRAEILDQRRVRVTLGEPLDGGPATLRYRISNGVADAEGTITVVEIPEPARVQAPIARDDAVAVRVGDVVDVAVLDNDEQPDGQDLELLPDLAEDLPAGGGLLFASGDRLRYLAPATAGNYSAVYSVSGEDGQVAQAAVRFSVREVDVDSNSAPVPRSVTARVIAGESVRIEVPLSTVDPDGDAVQLVGIASNPDKGTVESTVGGSIEYRAGDYSSGTDVFRYTVVDGLGARAEGVVRVGISPRLEGARNPVANEDVVAIRPGRTVSVEVLANDSDPDGSPLRVTAAVANSDDTVVEVVDERVVRITPPGDPGRYSAIYTIENEFGGSSEAFVSITVDPDAPLAVPVARDTVLTVSDVVDRQSIEVDVLDRVFFADGDVGELDVRLVPGFASSAVLTPDDRMRVSVEGQSQIIPFAVVHPDDASVRAFAFVWVPGYDDALPQLDRTAPPLEVVSEQSLTIELDEYIVTLGDDEVRIVDESTVSATHSDGGDLVVDEDTLRFTSADRYFGPASITLEVTDGATVDDPEGRRAVLTLPIEVTPRENQPPVFVGANVSFEPGESRELDLIRLTNYPYDDIDELEYSLLEPLPEGFDVALNGQRVVITAGLSTPTGSSAVARFGVRDAINEGQPGLVELAVVPSTRPLAQPAPDSAVTRRGATTVVDVLANDEAGNPFPGSPLRVVAIRGLDGATLPAGVAIAPSADRSRLTVTVAESAEPLDTNLQYQLADVTGDPARFVWGNVEISVQDVPDAVSNVQVTRFGDRSLDLSWTPGAANNSPIERYDVVMTSVADGAVLSTTACTTTVGCTVTTPGNGPDDAVRLAVSAVNAIGPSTPTSNATGAIWSDIIPPPPADVGWASVDQGLTISWRKPADSNAASPIERYVVSVAGESRTVVADPRDAVGTAYSVTIGGLAGVVNGSSVGYSVSARNSAPNSLASWNSATGSGIPAWTPIVVGSPSASGLASASGTTVAAQWAGVFSPNGRAISDYRVRIVSGSGPVACESASSVGTATGHDFTGLSPNTTYTVVVFASNGLGGCSAAATTSVTTRATPGTVTAMTAAAPEENGPGRWDHRLTGITTSGASGGHVQYRLVGEGVDGSASEVVPVGSTFLTSPNGSHYGVPVAVELRACAVWPEVTLCSPDWSAPLALGTAVENAPPPGLTATGGGLFSETEWTWSGRPGPYPVIEYACGAQPRQPFPDGPGQCSVSGVLADDDFTVWIVVGGVEYPRTYQPGDFD